MYYNVFLIRGMVMTEKPIVITMRLSRRDLEKIEAVRDLENVDRTALLKDFIEDGLRRRVIQIYKNGKLTASRASEILKITLREFLEMLEREGVAVNWNSETVKEYLKTEYGK
jgi:predicted HTH domain antitoxin